MPPPPPTGETSNIKSQTPTTFALEQNYPNPFNPTTELSFVIGHVSFVNLRIFDMLGREVATVVNKEMEPGGYTVQWDASNQRSGIYFYRLTAGKFSDTKKMLVIR